jgi:hypothetical protein
MPAFLIPWLLRLGMLVAFAVVLASLWWQINGWCNAACRIAEERATLAEETIKVAQARASALALLWARAIEHVETRYVEKVVIRERDFAGLRERAGKINSDVLVPMSVPELVILRDAAALAGTDSAPPAADSGASQGVPATAWTQFAIDAADAYADARDKHASCVAWANSITGAQSE